MLWDWGKTSAAHGDRINTNTNKQPKKRRAKRDRPTNQQTYQETTINGANLDFEDVESFGDVQQAEHDNILRVGFQNIHNLSVD
jgi:hypothetical protein